MASLAGLLQSQDYRVTGSDQNVYPPMSTYLERLGIQVLSGFTEEHLRERPQMVVIGNAVARNNPEVEAVLRLEIPYISFPQALGKFLIGSKRSVVVAGTHGKTTTSALISHILIEADYDPTIVIGGQLKNISSNARSGNGDFFVAGSVFKFHRVFYRSFRGEIDDHGLF